MQTPNPAVERGAGQAAFLWPIRLARCPQTCFSKLYFEFESTNKEFNLLPGE